MGTLLLILLLVVAVLALVGYLIQSYEKRKGSKVININLNEVESNKTTTLYKDDNITVTITKTKS